MKLSTILALLLSLVLALSLVGNDQPLFPGNIPDLAFTESSQREKRMSKLFLSHIILFTEQLQLFVKFHFNVPFDLYVTVIRQLWSMHICYYIGTEE